MSIRGRSCVVSCSLDHKLPNGLLFLTRFVATAVVAAAVIAADTFVVVATAVILYHSR